MEMISVNIWKVLLSSPVENHLAPGSLIFSYFIAEFFEFSFNLILTLVLTAIGRLGGVLTNQSMSNGAKT